MENFRTLDGFRGKTELVAGGVQDFGRGFGFFGRTQSVGDVLRTASAHGKSEMLRKLSMTVKRRGVLRATRVLLRGVAF
jgi:hypothetical protein